MSRKQPSFLRNHLIFFFQTCRSRDKLSAMRQLFFDVRFWRSLDLGQKIKIKKKFFCCTPQTCMYIIKKVLYKYILMRLRKYYLKLPYFWPSKVYQYLNVWQQAPVCPILSHTLKLYSLKLKPMGHFDPECNREWLQNATNHQKVTINKNLVINGI